VKHERATEETRQQAALYALGLLTQHEAHCFELHMEECDVCRAELARLLLASAQIGLAVSEQEPPEGFRERLAARIDSTPRPAPVSDLPKKQEPAPSKTPEPRKTSEPAKTFEPRTTSEPRKSPEPAKIPSYVRFNTPVPIEQPRSGKTAFVVNAIIYVLLAALAAFAFYSWRSAENDKLRLRNRIQTSLDDLADLRQQLASPMGNMENLERFEEMLRKPSVRVAWLKGRPLMPNCTGVVLWDGLTDDITVIGAFDPAPDGQTYRLWLSDSSKSISACLLPSDKNGGVFTSIKLEQGMSDKTGVTAIVTLESENDLLTRAAPEAQWIASGQVE